jgi:hypothetical protein
MLCRIVREINRGTGQHSGVANQMPKEQKARLSSGPQLHVVCKEVQRLSEAVQSQISGLMPLLSVERKCNLNVIQN